MNRVFVIAVMAAFGVCAFNRQLNAEVINITKGSTSGYTMTDGNTYVIQNSVSFSNSTVGGSGMTVADGATVVLYVPAGVTLTTKGKDSTVYRSGGGAGICVPATSTLVVTGEGIVIATGGDADNGTNGEKGGNAQGAYLSGEMPYAGAGGSGGCGGGGAGSGIGGCGGSSGNGESMGSVYVLGTINIMAYSGVSGSAGVAGSAGSMKVDHRESNYYYASGGGGGGGGGGGYAPNYSIGGGGCAGADGGRGGKGSITRIYNSTCPPGTTGSTGGRAGQNGGAGTLYVAPTATVNVEREKLEATTHPAAQYTIAFNANGGQFSSSLVTLTATLGCVLPDCISAPQRYRYAFEGWAEDSGGMIMWYDPEGDKMLSSYMATESITLYAIWTALPVVDAPTLTPVSGTIFKNSLSVSISCLTEGAEIHYTTDGNDPSEESPVYRRFRINSRTIVKAMAVKEGLCMSDIVTAEYALGQCADPVITPNDGATFD